MDTGNGTGRAVLTVTQLNREIRELLDGALPLLWVEGEISNLARPASGHVYFSLKDARAQVRCALFRQRAGLLRFRPENGQQVLVRARVSLYEPRGDYQLLIDSMEAAGDGLLRRRFEQLRQKLEAEGLFREERKRRLPRLSRRIAAVTSPSGAAIRDVLQVLRRRFPGIPVRIYPVPVQGQDAATEIVRMLRIADADPENDVLLLTRGGGSLEDLQPFNEESVARAMVACRLPVVSAVGHEIDVTISDLAADVRAPTPSAAAELLSPDRLHWLRNLTALHDRLAGQQRRRLAREHERLLALDGRLQRQHPGRQLLDRAQRLDRLELSLQRRMHQCIQDRRRRLQTVDQRLQLRHPGSAIRQGRERLLALSRQLLRGQRGQLERLRQRFGRAGHALENISPLATVSRGYAILARDDGRVVRSVGDVSQGQQVSARLADGQLRLEVLGSASKADEAGDG
ncbi:exodeoxyribonuclease VII large subunit [Methylonatrum kenyense]|uniref:exodeoxyribonuclease VII large subunit n=1 Tax=Methylonatrum kenyense TaxID=455253 RepID=UPI0020BDC4AA|nr:exodeoxyribonuclease VII large subunit [Methylonatrum kenyense]MCK8515567.1 exodeoxyribonuclease VII large subunit [Methylonatrum kenyense]